MKVFSDKLRYIKTIAQRIVVDVIEFNDIYRNYRQDLVEREGFEPSVRYRTPAFQASKLNHSDISPKQ